MKTPFVTKAQLEEITARYPTPFHLYDEAGMRRNARQLNRAFAWAPSFREYFAVKATPTPAILKILKEEGCGADCSSLTELMLAEKCGFRGHEIMFTSNNTLAEEFQLAHRLGAILNLDDITHVDFLEQSIGCIPETVFCRYNPGGVFTLAETREGCLVVHYNIRYPVTHRGELVKEGLEKTFAPAGWQLTVTGDSAPMYLPADDPKVRELSRVYAEVTGKDATPYVMGGGTYARHIQNAVGFGMESRIDAGLPAGHGGVHEPDEAVKIDDLVEAIKIYVLSILEVDQILHS